MNDELAIQQSHRLKLLGLPSELLQSCLGVKGLNGQVQPQSQVPSPVQCPSSASQ